MDEDRRVYLELLQEQARKYGLEVLAYCLMTNHVHLVALKYVELNPVRAKLCRWADRKRHQGAMRRSSGNGDRPANYLTVFPNESWFSTQDI